MSRTILFAAAVSLTIAGSALAQNQRKAAQDSPQAGQAQRLNFDRGFQAGQQFMLTGRASKTFGSHTSQDRRSATDRGSEAAASQKDRNSPNAQSDQKSNQNAKGKAVFITGKLQIVKVDKQGDPTELKLTVHEFRAVDSTTGKPSGGDSAEDKKLIKGSIIVAKAKDDDVEFMIEKGDSKISGDLAKALKVILPICDSKKSKQGFSEALRGQQTRKQGESWDVEKKDVPKSHQDMGLVYSRATFVATKKLHGVDCAVVLFQLSATPLKTGAKGTRQQSERTQPARNNSAAARSDADKAAGGKSAGDKSATDKNLKAVGARAFVFLPIKQELPPLRAGGTIAFLVDKPAGASADKPEQQKTGSGKVLQLSFVRDLQPIDRTASKDRDSKTKSQR